MRRVFEDNVSGTVWVASEHDVKYRPPRGITDSRSVEGSIGDEKERFYLGSPPALNVNGIWRNGSRVSFEYWNSWWHITRCDQRLRDGVRPNMYEIVEMSMKNEGKIRLIDITGQSPRGRRKRS